MAFSFCNAGSASGEGGAPSKSENWSSASGWRSGRSRVSFSIRAAMRCTTSPHCVRMVRAFANPGLPQPRATRWARASTATSSPWRTDSFCDLMKRSSSLRRMGWSKSSNSQCRVKREASPMFPPLIISSISFL